MMHMWLLALDGDLRSWSRQINSPYFPVTCWSGLTFEAVVVRESSWVSVKEMGMTQSWKKNSSTRVTHGSHIRGYKKGSKWKQNATGSNVSQQPSCQHGISTWNCLQEHKENQVGKITLLSKGGIKMIADTRGSYTKTLHLIAISKLFSRLPNFPRACREKQRVRMSWKKRIQSADLKTNIVWLTFPAFSFYHLSPPTPAHAIT